MRHLMHFDMNKYIVAFYTDSSWQRLSDDVLNPNVGVAQALVLQKVQDPSAFVDVPPYRIYSSVNMYLCIEIAEDDIPKSDFAKSPNAVVYTLEEFAAQNFDSYNAPIPHIL